MDELFNAHGWKMVMETALLPDGRTKKAVRAYRPDSVHLLAFPELGKVLILREYRPFYGDWIWMLPSGRADKETDLRQAAQRELQEETGFRAGKLTPFGTTRNTESVEYANHFFIAEELSPSSLPQDDDEMIEVHTFTLEEALDNILTSPVIHTPSAFALFTYIRQHA